MEDSILTFLALCGFFTIAVSLNIMNPYHHPGNIHSALNYKRPSWQNSLTYDPTDLLDQPLHYNNAADGSSVFLPENLDELRQWWNNVAAQQRPLYPDTHFADLGGPSPNFEEDFSDNPQAQDYNYFYEVDPFSEPQTSDEAFRQALKAYILPGNPFLSSDAGVDYTERTADGDSEPSSLYSDQQNILKGYLGRSYPQGTPKEEVQEIKSKKPIPRTDLPPKSDTGVVYPVSLPSTEVTSQTPLASLPSVFSSTRPITKTKGQKEFAMLRPPSDNVRKFDQWAKSAQDFMESVATAAVRETREVRQRPKSEDNLPQQLNSLKRRSKRHAGKRFRGDTLWH